MTLGWALIIIVLLLLAWKSPKFRKGLLISAGAIALLLVALLLYYQEQAKLREQRIVPSELELFQDVLKPRQFGNGYALTGEARNRNPRYNVSSFHLQLRLYDCPREAVGLSECEPIYTAEDFVSVAIPAGQRRSFEADFYTSNMPSVKGNLTYEIRTLRVRAD